VDGELVAHSGVAVNGGSLLPLEARALVTISIRFRFPPVSTLTISRSTHPDQVGMEIPRKPARSSMDSSASTSGWAATNPRTARAKIALMATILFR